MKWKFYLFALILAAGYANADRLTVSIETPDGSLLEGAVVYLTSDKPLPVVENNKVADMDQVNKQFSPHILVVQKDTQVRFPNSDSIKHHVYSFSPAKTFELQLYKGVPPTPLPFDKNGMVEMGCNVHDWMLGYVYVVDTPYFSQVEQGNMVTLEAPPGEYVVHIRHPRIQDNEDNLSKALHLAGDVSTQFALNLPLLPGLDEFEDEDSEFSDYD